MPTERRDHKPFLVFSARKLTYVDLVDSAPRVAYEGRYCTSPIAISEPGLSILHIYHYLPPAERATRALPNPMEKPIWMGPLRYPVLYNSLIGKGHVLETGTDCNSEPSKPVIQVRFLVPAPPRTTCVVCRILEFIGSIRGRRKLVKPQYRFIRVSPRITIAYSQPSILL